MAGGTLGVVFGADTREAEGPADERRKWARRSLTLLDVDA